MQINKKYLKSKTLWMAVVIALLPTFPEVQEFMKDDPEAVGYIIAGVMGFMRSITKDSLWGNE